MKGRRRLHVWAVLALLVSVGIGVGGATSAMGGVGLEDAAGAPASAPLGTAFTYQGELKDAGGTVDGTCQFRFDLYDAAGSGEPPSGGTLLGSEPLTNVPITGGLFTVQLDFGAGAFSGDARWVEVAVDCGGGFTTLSPRQALTPAPHALYSANGPFWSLTGNAGTTPGPNFLGTSDNAALVVKVDNTRALRIEPSSEAPNLIGGWWENYVTGSVRGATIAGGGSGEWGENRVTDDFGTVGGGVFNQAGDESGTTADRAYATVGGGFENTAGGVGSTVSGGKINRASGYGATVGGGVHNNAHGYLATVGGGGSTFDYAGNRATDSWTTVCGGTNNQAGNGVDNGGEGSGASVGGGAGNLASGEGSTVSGGISNVAGEDYATVGGGLWNVASGTSAVVAGGDSNTASGLRSTVPGGVANTAVGDHSFAAGRRAKALHNGAFVWADSTDVDFASDAANQFLVRAYNGVKIVRGASTFSPSQSALQVDQAIAAEAAWFYTAHASNPFAVLKVAKDPAAPGNFIDGVERTSGGAETRKFHITKNGTYEAGSDFAESLPVAGGPAGYEPGDVLVISLDRPGAVEKCNQPYDGLVVGVYSTRPGFLGADKGGTTEVAEDEVPVAVLGIVPVKVTDENGTVQPGDLLTTSSTAGHAMRCAGLERCFGRTLGKALEGLPSGQSTGVVQMLVSLQ